jgi:hypothetical protein
MGLTAYVPQTTCEGRQPPQNVKAAHTLGKAEGEWPLLTYIKGKVVPLLN